MGNYPGMSKDKHLYDGEKEVVPKCSSCGEYHTSKQCAPRAKIEGMGNTVPTYTNETGGKQSDIPYRFDLLPPLSLAKVAKILSQGAVKYGENNWHKIPVKENLNHALAHIVAFLASDNQEDHLRNALCRVFFASEVDLIRDLPEREECTEPTRIKEEIHAGQAQCGRCNFVASAHKYDELMNRYICPTAGGGIGVFRE